VGGRTLHTSVTVTRAAILASFLSMGASTRPILHTNRIYWRRRTLPCVPSWCAGTFLSMVACWHATASSRGFLQMTRTAAARVATLRRVTAATATAVDLAITLAAARPPRLSRPIGPSHWSAKGWANDEIWRFRAHLGIIGDNSAWSREAAP
jgi:hypothetical protein